MEEQLKKASDDDIFAVESRIRCLIYKIKLTENRDWEKDGQYLNRMIQMVSDMPYHNRLMKYLYILYYGTFDFPLLNPEFIDDPGSDKKNQEKAEELRKKEYVNLKKDGYSLTDLCESYLDYCKRHDKKRMYELSSVLSSLELEFDSSLFELLMEVGAKSEAISYVVNTITDIHMAYELFSRFTDDKIKGGFWKNFMIRIHLF